MKETLFGGHGTQRPPSGGHATSTHSREKEYRFRSLSASSFSLCLDPCVHDSERVSVCVCVSVHLCFNVIILFCFNQLWLLDVSQIFPAANCCAQDFSSFLIL